MSKWTWKNATPMERGESVRAHVKHCVSRAELCVLFNLTQEGCQKILDGEIWRPEHSVPEASDEG